jgi:hypothetical protein
VTRQPNFHWDVVREDRPAPGRSYPRRVAGYPSRPIVLTTDARGLRNAPAEGPYDVIVAGDSFTEGSMVSDGEPWWAQLARASGLRIYNTAVSGLSIEDYLNNWVAFGLDTGARTLVVMIYEGNDWKPLAPPPPAQAGFFDVALGDSPLRWRAQLALVQLLAPIGADRPPPPSPGLAWMPIVIDAGGASHAYAFEPKHLMRLDWDPAAFAAAPEWTTNEAVLGELVAIAQARGVRLVIAYAPSKPHVLMPLVRDRVTAEQIRAFAGFRDRDDPLPDADRLREQLYARLDTEERVVGAWCAAHGVPFVSLTEPLRRAVGEGVPVYFTYDIHWTEEGHAVAARALRDVVVPPGGSR